MPCLSTQQFLTSKPSLKRERVELPELGPDAYVYARELTAAERGRLMDQQMEPTQAEEGGKPSISMRQEGWDVSVVLAGTVDEGGAPLFQPAHREELAGWGSEVIGRISKAISELSGLGAKKGAAKGN